MKVKNILKVLLFGAVCIGACGLLWNRAHASYPAEQNYGDLDGNTQTISFPKTVQKKVSEGLSYDANIIVGENFSPQELYQSTAKIAEPDLKKWEAYFYAGTDIKKEKDTQFSTRNGGVCNGVGYETENASGYISEQDGLFCTSAMRQIFDVLNENVNSATYNQDKFSTDSELSFQSRAENKKVVFKMLKELGIDAQYADIVATYSMDLPTLIAQQKERVQAGDIEQDEVNPTWNESDEGYLYFVEQNFQGIPVYKNKELEGNASLGEERVPMEIYASSSGIQYFSMGYWYKFERGKERLTLVPFDEIMKTINMKYEKAMLDEPLVVKKCELVAYPFETGENKYLIIPVWICQIMIQGKSAEENFGQAIYLPINAVTGEEFVEMEIQK